MIGNSNQSFRLHVFAKCSALSLSILFEAFSANGDAMASDLHLYRQQ
jgi:hypothetical protein